MRETGTYINIEFHKHWTEPLKNPLTWILMGLWVAITFATGPLVAIITWFLIVAAVVLINAETVEIERIDNYK